MPYKITAVCAFGLESELKYEIRKLGYDIDAVTDGAVTVKGELRDAAVLNLWLRCANRVLIEIATGEAKTFDELFSFTESIVWEDYLPDDAAFDVTRISCVKSQLLAKRDCQKIVKKAIVERLKRVRRLRELPESGAYYPLTVSIKNDTVRVYLDTSGESLHRRGYRTAAGGAPLKETLAAGILMLSRYDSRQEFADFMCGSGTLVIEAAMMAANIAPGLKRSFAMEKWALSSDLGMDELRNEAAAARVIPPARILGSDIDGAVVARAHGNAARAGVDDICFFQKLDMREFSSKKNGGLIAVNPPYGERIGRSKNIAGLYADMHTVWQKLENRRLAVLCGNPDFQREFGEKATANRKLYNGELLTYLYMYAPYQDMPGKNKKNG